MKRFGTKVARGGRQRQQSTEQSTKKMLKAKTKEGTEVEPRPVVLHG